MPSLPPDQTHARIIRLPARRLFGRIWGRPFPVVSRGEAVDAVSGVVREAVAEHWRKPTLPVTRRRLAAAAMSLTGVLTVIFLHPDGDALWVSHLIGCGLAMYGVRFGLEP